MYLFIVKLTTYPWYGVAYTSRAASLNQSSADDGRGCDGVRVYQGAVRAGAAEVISLNLPLFILARQFVTTISFIQNSFHHVFEQNCNGIHPPLKSEINHLWSPMHATYYRCWPMFVSSWAPRQCKWLTNDDCCWCLISEFEVVVMVVWCDWTYVID